MEDWIKEARIIPKEKLSNWVNDLQEQYNKNVLRRQDANKLQEESRRRLDISRFATRAVAHTIYLSRLFKKQGITLNTSHLEEYISYRIDEMSMNDELRADVKAEAYNGLTAYIKEPKNQHNQEIIKKCISFLEDNNLLLLENECLAQTMTMLKENYNDSSKIAQN